MLFSAVLLACAAVASAQFQCPLEDGYYRDPVQCDKYYDCYRGEMKEELCSDGLVFDDAIAPRVAQCNYPFLVSCPEGATLQTPLPSGIECPRMNGYFEHEDPANCDQYYECTNGGAVLRTCSTGLVFDEFTGTCQWAHTGIRVGCGVRVEQLEDGFRCPNTTQVHTNGHVLDHARYIKPDDCRSFYLCMEGKFPSISGCPQGTVFNDLTLNCDDPANVPGCENYYDEIGGGPPAGGPPAGPGSF